MLSVWFCSVRVHCELVKWQTGYKEAKKICLRGSECVDSGFTKTSNILKTLHTIPPTYIHQSKYYEGIMHSHQQAINLYIGIIQIQQTFSRFTASCFCTYTLKQFSFHIHEHDSLSIDKAWDLMFTLSNH